MGRNGLAIVAVAACAGLARGDDADWMSDSNGVLELRLAHRDTGRVDGGTLRLDRERRTISWEGAANEIGCARRWQASFDDVADVRADAPGFVLVMGRGPEKEVRLAPLPHFRHLIGLGRDRALRPHVRELLKDRDGDPIVFGGASGSTAPVVTPPGLPPEVQRDSAAAADAILRALGRASR